MHDSCQRRGESDEMSGDTTVSGDPDLGPLVDLLTRACSALAPADEVLASSASALRYQLRLTSNRP